MSHSIYQDLVSRDRVGGPIEGRTVFLGQDVFCQAIQRGIEANPARWPTDGDLWDKRMWRSFPWITPLLGSGTLGLPEAIVHGASELPGRVKAYWDTDKRGPQAEKKIRDFLGNEEIGDREDVLDRLESYVRGLLRDRLGASWRKLGPVGVHSVPADEALEPTLSPLAMLMLLTGSEVTGLFHDMSRSSSRLVSRRDTGQAHLSEFNDDDPVPDRCDELLKASLKLLESSDELLATSAVKHLEAIRTDLDNYDGPTLKARQVKTLSDLAWHFLVRSPEGSSDYDYPYPGWSDLIVELSLATGGSIGRAQLGGVAMSKLTESVVKVIRPAAESSWLAHPAETLTEAQRFHDAIAEVLVSQSDTRERIQGVKESLQSQFKEAQANRDLHKAKQLREAIQSVPQLPHAVAFLTTFDLELEAALCRRMNDFGRLRQRSADSAPSRISMIVPAYYREHGNADRADFLWLEAVVEIDENETLSHMMNCDPGRPLDWRVMSASRTDVPQHPIVVHLSGAPLVNLPDPAQNDRLRAELRALNIGADSDTGGETLAGHFLHAVTVDEYLALRQSELELHLMQASQLGGRDQESPHKAYDRSFPQQLMATSVPGPVRYWTALGVPLMDPAVRHRVYSHMTRMRFLPPPSSESKKVDQGEATVKMEDQARVNARKEVYGMSVNLRIDPEEAVLMSTLDVSVITGLCESFTDDLLHYAEHVRAAGPGARPVREHCLLGG